MCLYHTACPAIGGEWSDIWIFGSGHFVTMTKFEMLAVIERCGARLEGEFFPLARLAGKIWIGKMKTELFMSHLQIP